MGAAPFLSVLRWAFSHSNCLPCILPTLQADQRAFGLFEEPEITFVPTYKYVKGTRDYDAVSTRVPSVCRPPSPPLSIYFCTYVFSALVQLWLSSPLANRLVLFCFARGDLALPLRMRTFADGACPCAPYVAESSGLIASCTGVGRGAPWAWSATRRVTTSSPRTTTPYVHHTAR